MRTSLESKRALTRMSYTSKRAPALASNATTLGLALLAALGSGCQRHAQRTVAHTHAYAGGPTNRSAVAAIADARCDREQRCGNIGSGGKYASKHACNEQVRREWAEPLNGRECPRGVNEEELEECLEDIRGEDCNNPFDSLERVLSCGTVEICRG